MKNALRFALSALSLTISAATAHAQKPAIPVTLTSMDLDISVNYPERTLTGTATMRVRNHESTPVARIPIQVNRLMEVSAVTDQRGAPLNFSQDVVRYSDWRSRQMNQVWIDLPRALAPNDTTSFIVKWDGYVTPYTETGMLYVRDKIDSAFTILRHESGAFPVLAVPSAEANRSVPLADADLSVRVTVPIYEVVATGGTQLGRTESDGAVTYAYRLRLPALMLNIAIAPYRMLESNVRIAYFGADSAGAMGLLAAARSALDSMTQWFGPVNSSTKPFVIEIGDGYGSQASLAGGIFQTPSAFRSKEGYGEAYHEFSHLWNPPSAEPAPSRWNEGLAMFLEYLLMSRLDGWTGRDSFTQSSAERFIKRHEADSLVTKVPLIDYGRRGSTDYSYSVGDFMLYVLYETLGADNFNRIIGGFYQKYRTTGATDSEFVQFAKEQAPYDLSVFFDDWFFTTKWYDRLSRGETLHALAPRYRIPKKKTM